jgi:hypothetical protein
MLFTIFEVVTFNISKILESLFDAIEYRLALRAFRHAARTKAKRRSQTNVANTLAATRVSDPVSMRVA